jgi:hypothetical protein
VLALIVVRLTGAVESAAQPGADDERSQFRFEFAQTQGHRGLGVEGWVYNDLRWRVTDVRVRVDCVDASDAVIASGAGWVIGDVPAGGRGYFYVPIASRGAGYRVSVQSFHRVSLERPVEAP